MRLSILAPKTAKHKNKPTHFKKSEISPNFLMLKSNIIAKMKATIDEILANNSIKILFSNNIIFQLVAKVH